MFVSRVCNRLIIRLSIRSRIINRLRSRISVLRGIRIRCRLQHVFGLVVCILCSVRLRIGQIITASLII